MRYRLMATYQGQPYEAGIGPSEGDVVLFAACPPPEELGFEPATGHWRKQLRIGDVQALWESRPTGTFRGEPCIILDDLGDRLHIAFLGHDAYLAERLGYWQVDRGVFELITPRDEVLDVVEERADYPHRSAAPWQAAGLGTTDPGFGAAEPGFGAGAPAYSPAAPAAYSPAADAGYGPAGPPPGYGPAGYSPAGPDTGYGPAEADGYGPAGPDAGYGPAEADGYGPAGPDAGYGRAGPPPGYGPAGPDAEYGPAAPSAGSSPAGPDTGYGPAAPGAGYGPAAPPPPGYGSATIPGLAPVTSDPGFGSAMGAPGLGLPPYAVAPAVPTAPPGVAVPSYEEAPLPLEAAALRATSAASRQAPPQEPAAEQAGEPSSSPAASSSPSRRRRRAAPRRLATQRTFSELANLAAIPAASYAVGAEVDGAMCLLQTEHGYEVFNAMAGARHEVRVFDDEESAYFYLFGVLAAEAVRTGGLVPHG